MKKILLVDFFNILYQSFYALYQMRNSKGVHTGGIYGFVKQLKKVIHKYDITNPIICMDGMNKIKKKEYQSYKAHRDTTPNELILQKDTLIKYLEEIGMPLFFSDEHEADDVIYSIIKSDIFAQDEIFILSSDKDLHPLAFHDNVNIITKDKVVSKEELFKKYTTKSCQENKLYLLKSLSGDRSDNISGVKGIGEKTALKIISEYSTIEEVYSALDNGKEIISKAISTTLKENKEKAFISSYLVLPLMLPHHKITTFFNECKPWQTSLLEKGEHILFDLECFSLCTQQKKNELLSKKEEQNNNLPYAKNLFTSKIPDKKEDYEKIQKELKAASYVAIDTETDFGDPRKANVIGYSLCTNKANAWYIPLIIDNERVAQYNENRNLLEAIHTDAIIIMHNALFDLHALSRIRIFFKNKIFDTMLTAFFLKEKKIGLKELSSTLLKEKMESFFSVLTQYEAKTFDEIPLKEAKLYAATDARQTFLLYAYYQEKLLQDEHAKLREYLNTIEMPLIKVLFNIEQTGIYCSETALNKEEKKYLELLSKVKKELLEVAEKYGMESFNPASNKQTATLLYTHLGLSKVLKGTRTDNVTLKNIELHHPIISSIILYRSTLSNITHFTTGLKRHIESDNKIHTHYQQLSTVTGRITTMNPNLQSLPKKTSFINIREAFYCGKDNILVSFDYSQIEIHVLAALSQDPLLVGLLKNNEDIHTETATKLFNKEKKDITKEERQIGKKINFSVLYGQEAYSLSRELKISQAEAKNYLTIFKETYAGIFSWIEKITQEAIQKGFVETFYGNRRIIPELQDSNKIILKIGKRQSVNTIVQGTAAELMKKAMIAVYNYLENKQRGNIVLQIHDEILVEMKDDKNTDSVIAKITDIMEKVGDPLFDLKVAHTRGRTWS